MYSLKTLRGDPKRHELVSCCKHRWESNRYDPQEFHYRIN